MGTVRRIKKQLKAKRMDKANAAMNAWPDNVRQVYRHTVQRLVVGGKSRQRAEWMAYQACVAGIAADKANTQGQ